MTLSKKDFYSEFEKIEDLEKVREFIVNEYFVPIALEFLKDQEVKFVALAFAQYYNDEASDAVHDAIIPVYCDEFIWEQACDPNINKAFKKEGKNYATSYLNSVQTIKNKLYGNYYDGPYLDNDEKYISAFERYCEESLGEDSLHDYKPYVIASLKNNELNIRLIGDLVRVWS